MLNRSKPLFPLAVLLAVLSGCVSAPPAVVKLHMKEAELIGDLRAAHLALVDAYIAEKLANFETFYFNEYGPRFRVNWEAAFRQSRGRPYDPEQDFPLFYNDLVAEYQDLVRPINEIRHALRASIDDAYGQVEEAHAVIGDWIESVHRLSSSQRRTANEVLAAADPSLSVESIESAFAELRKRLLQAE